MGIVEERAPFFDAEALAAVLLRGGRGVFRLSEGGAFRASCWWLTDALLVAPGFAVSGVEAVDVEETAGGERLRARVEARLAADHPEEALLLLRAERPLAGRAATLRFDRPPIGEPLLLLHYPDGRPRVQLTMGRALGHAGGRFAHDANSEGGSAGGALLDLGGRLVGMHLGATRDFAGVEPPTGARLLNYASTTGAILEQLRHAPCWREVADHHRVATPAPASAVRRAPRADPARLLPFALRWSVAPASLDDDARATLRPHVVDPSAPVWRMTPGARREALRRAGSLDALRAARGDAPPDDAGQRVIDRILRGPPFDLGAEPFASLPFWLQAARWFEGVVPGLPDPAAVHRVMERRRVRERLAEVVGEDFVGRARELARMDAWLARDDAGVLVVSGPGGIGKSALVARFAQRLAPDALLLWLDFDRADLAADDVDSIVAALAAQLRAQRELPADEPVDGLGALGARLAREARPPLLVLDSFEVAQHAPRHEAIWDALKDLLARAPRVHVLVSGRAAVGVARVADRPVDPMTLGGLSAEDADALLRLHGERLVRDLPPAEAAARRASYPLFDGATRARVVDLSRGSPLRLTLATRLFDVGGGIDDLPKRWTDAVLYQRILDRVLDPALKNLARGALVLRRLTVPSLQALLAAHLPEGVGAEEAFARLKREMALVTGDDVLRLRPELRTETLRLLEVDDAAFVRDLDARAAAWYGAQPGPESALEAVYHRLRAGDVAGAEAGWREEFRGALRDALDDLDGAARAWLEARVRAPAVAEPTHEAWERDALGRVRNALSRGVVKAAADTLGERRERAPGSALRFYDAWVALANGDAAGAREALEGTEALDGEVGWRQRVLLAYVASRQGERKPADLWLARAERLAPGGLEERAAVVAARLRLTMALAAEARLVDHGGPGPGRGVLTTYDVLLPQLRSRLAPVGGLESVSSGWVLDLEGAPPSSWGALLRVYHQSWPQGGALAEGLRSVLEGAEDTTEGTPLWDRRRVLAATKGAPASADAVAVALAGWRRWALATRLGALDPLFVLAERDAVEDLLSAASVCALTLFARAPSWRLQCLWRGRPLEDHLERIFLGISRSSLGMPLRAPEDDADARAVAAAAAGLPSTLVPGRTSVREAAMIFLETRGRREPPPHFLLFHLLPDPLALLVERLAGAKLPAHKE